MTIDRFFTYLNRVNAVVIFLVLVFFLVTFARDYWNMRSWEHEPGMPTEYGNNAFDNGVEGEEIKTSIGGVVLYRSKDELRDRLNIEARNITLTDMHTGRSRVIVPEGSDHLVFSFEVLASPSESEEYSAWVALSGTEQDYSDGVLDLQIGRFSDLEQRTLARRLRFVDSPRLIDSETLSIIVWPEVDRAEFWIVNMKSFSIESRRPVALPLPADANSKEAAATMDEPLIVVDGL